MDEGRPIPLTEARAQLAELVGRVAYGGERVQLSRHGRVRAVLVSAEDFERLEALDAAQGGTESEPRPVADREPPFSAHEPPMSRHEPPFSAHEPPIGK